MRPTTKRRDHERTKLRTGNLTHVSSVQIQADYRRYVKMFGAHTDLREFARLFWERA